MAEKKKDEKEAKGKGAAKESKAARAPGASKEAKGKDRKAAKAAVQESSAERASEGPETKLPDGYQPRLKKAYASSAVAALSKRFGYKNPMMVPRLQKVVINMGLGAAVSNPKIIDSAVIDMRSIAGQQPVITRARKSIATFKLRERLPIGVMVTLRRDRMWEFVDRLVSVSLPRVRDFKGVSPKGFDGRGNFTMGLREQIIFPEVDYDRIDVAKGMNISFITTARTDDEGRALLTELGIPFRH